MGGLVAFHAGLAVWAMLGLLEWILPSTPWPRLGNPLFPPRLLLVQWISVLVASSGFLIGYWTRWSQTPHFMVLGYSAMASVCALETFGFLEHSGRFLDMGLEYLAYTFILVVLFLSEARWHFRHDASPR